MATDMGRGIVAPDSNENISSTGVGEMRTLGATTASAISDVEVQVTDQLVKKIDKTEAYEVLLPRDEAVQYGIEGRPGTPGEQGPPGIPAAGAEPEDTAVSSFLAAEHSQTGTTARDLFAARDHSAIASATSVEYWVAPDGDDTTDGSEDYPLGTIAAAVAKLPDIIRAGHTYTITLAPGEWNELLNLEHILVYGLLEIRGSSGDADRHKVLNFTAESVLGHAKFESITFTRPGPGVQMRFNRCAPFMEVRNVKTLADPSLSKGVTGSIGLLADYGSQVHIVNSEFNDRRYGIRSNYMSRVHSHDNTGTNNTFGVGARWGGIVSTYGTQPSGDTTLTNSSGGILTRGQGSKIGIPEGESPALMEQWGNQPDGQPFRKYWGIRSNNTNINDAIGASQRLRLTLERVNNGPTMIDVKWVGATSSSHAHHQHKRFAGNISTNTFSPADGTIISSYVSSGASTYITFEPQGNGVFYVYITPGQEILAGQWGVDLEYSLMRGIHSARLTDVRVV